MIFFIRLIMVCWGYSLESPRLIAWPGAMINTHKFELPLSRTYFHGTKGVRAIEVLLYHGYTYQLEMFFREKLMSFLLPIPIPNLRGGIKKFWASGIFPIQIVQCFTPNVQKCVRYWLHLGSYCWLSLFSHNTWSKIHTPIELAKWTKLSTERW